MTVSSLDSSANLNTALAAVSGTDTVSRVELEPNLGGMEESVITHDQTLLLLVSSFFRSFVRSVSQSVSQLANHSFIHSSVQPSIVPLTDLAINP